MTYEIAAIIANSIGLYLTLGLLFSIYFVFMAVNKLDANAKEGSFGFRLMIFFGSIFLWPILIKRLINKDKQLDINAHDRAASRGNND